MFKFVNTSVCVLVTAVVLVTTVGCTKKVDDTDTTINSVIKANVKGLDPMRSNDLYSNTVNGQIYEGLLQYHYLKRPLELQPALAESMPVVTDNGLTHTFKLKSGVRFHDDPAFPDGKGREITAEDFIYSWKRLADPRNASEGFWIFDGKIKGLNEWASAVKNEKADYSTPVEGLQAPDKNTLVVKLTEPYYQLYYVLAMPFAAVVPKEAVDKYGEEFINHPVGTGPYKLKEWIRGSKIVLEKNPTWRGETYPADGEPGDKERGLLEDAGKPLPFAEKIVFTELLEDQPRWQNFLKGNFDYAEIPKDNFANTVQGQNLVADLQKKGMKLDITPAVDVTYVGFNMKDPVLGQHKKLRQAMSLAYDTATSIERFQNGRAVQAHGPIPPGVSGYDAKFTAPYSKFDLEKAKALLKEAGFEGGKGLPTFTYETLSDPTSRQMAEFFQQQMAQIGVKVTVSTNTWPQFQEKIKGMKTQLFGIAWGADYPDGQNFLQLFYSRNASPGPNDSSYSNPAFDKLYEASLKLPPGPDRDKLYAQMRDIVMEDMPWIFNTHRLGYRPYHGWLNNFKWNDIQSDTFKYLRVDPKKRAELKPGL